MSRTDRHLVQLQKWHLPIVISGSCRNVTLLGSLSVYPQTVVFNKSKILAFSMRSLIFMCILPFSLLLFPSTWNVFLCSFSTFSIVIVSEIFFFHSITSVIIPVFLFTFIFSSSLILFTFYCHFCSEFAISTISLANTSLDVSVSFSICSVSFCSVLFRSPSSFSMRFFNSFLDHYCK